MYYNSILVDMCKMPKNNEVAHESSEKKYREEKDKKKASRAPTLFARFPFGCVSVKSLCCEKRKSHEKVNKPKNNECHFYRFFCIIIRLLIS